MRKRLVNGVDVSCIQYVVRNACLRPVRICLLFILNGMRRRCNISSETWMTILRTAIYRRPVPFGNMLSTFWLNLIWLSKFNYFEKYHSHSGWSSAKRLPIKNVWDFFATLSNGFSFKVNPPRNVNVAVCIVDSLSPSFSFTLFRLRPVGLALHCDDCAP